MAAILVIASAGSGDPPPRRVEAQCNQTTEVGPVLEDGLYVQRTRRKLQAIHIKGENSSQSRFEVTKPVTGKQVQWRGEIHPIGPLDKLFVVDDVQSENHLGLINENGDPIDWNYQATTTDGEPI